MSLSFDWTSSGLKVEGAGPWGPSVTDAFPIPAEPEYSVTSKLRILDKLIQDELAELEQNAARVPFETLYEIDSFERAALGLPTRQIDVRISLRSRGYPRVDGGFEIVPQLTLPDGEIVPRFQRVGGWVRSGRSGFLVSRSSYNLLQRLDDGVGPTLEDQHRFVAEVCNLARECEADLDPFLENQEYETPTSIGLEIMVQSEDHLSFAPIPEGVEEEYGELEDSDGLVRTIHTKRDGNKRKRLVLSEEQKNAVTAVASAADLRGSDVPRFLDNPEAFLPDQIDISRFSPRVRGFLPTRYRSQPYLDVREGKESRDWFTVSPRFEMLADQGPLSGDLWAGPDIPDGEAFSRQGEDLISLPQDPGPSPEEYLDLCRQVVESGESYVLHEGTWIHIDPERAERFLLAFNEAEVMPNGDWRIGRECVGFVLDVISNVDQLEFGFETETEKPALIDPPEYPMPEAFNGELYPYQEFGYRWLRYLHENEYGGLLADEMGLGKTVQVAALLAHLAESGSLGPSLLVVPNSLVVNWRKELARFCPMIRGVLEHHGPDRRRDPHFLGVWDLVITTYGTLRRDQLVLGEVDWQVIACDEAQNVKNPTTQVTSAVKGMKARMRLALTGTPVENGLSELWCIVDYVQPGKLGSWSNFRSRFERPLLNAPDEDKPMVAEQLQVQLGPHYVRRKKAHVLKDLPSKSEYRECIGLSDMQERAYATILKKRQEGEMIALTALQRLIQICSHPALLGQSAFTASEYLEACPKLQKTVEILQGVEAVGEKVVIYTRYKRMQDILQEVVHERFGVFAPIINGEDAGRARQARVDEFNMAPGFGILILSPEAAGVGLNITGANHVIHYTRLWNPAKENQATDRVHRIGQDRPVSVHYPIVVIGEGSPSVEEHMDRLLQEKSRLAENVLWPRENLSIIKDLERAMTGPEN
jgi:superfamily II DNA or RNA helicase